MECKFPKFIQCKEHPGYGAALCTHAAQVLQEERDTLKRLLEGAETQLKRCLFTNPDNYCYWRDIAVPSLQRRVEEAEHYLDVANKTANDALTHLASLKAANARLVETLTRCKVALDEVGILTVTDVQRIIYREIDAALSPTPSAGEPRHVCGAHGFGAPGDVCEACEVERANRDAGRAEEKP